jgi:hypothetical protein
MIVQKRPGVAVQSRAKGLRVAVLLLSILEAV